MWNEEETPIQQQQQQQKLTLYRHDEMINKMYVRNMNGLFERCKRKKQSCTVAWDITEGPVNCYSQMGHIQSQRMRKENVSKAMQ